MTASTPIEDPRWNRGSFSIPIIGKDIAQVARTKKSQKGLFLLSLTPLWGAACFEETELLSFDGSSVTFEEA